MVKSKYEIVWDNEAIIDFNIVVKYLKKESPEGAKKVQLEILKIIKSLPANPLIFEPDRFRTDSDPAFRAFSVYHYRITYRIISNYIHIMRVRHTSQEPLEY